MEDQNAKNTTTEMRSEDSEILENEMEEENMSENKEKETGRKPVGKGTPKNPPKQEAKVPWYKKPFVWMKENKKFIFTALGGAATGAAATYGVGKLGEHMANKKAASREYPVETEDNFID